MKLIIGILTSLVAAEVYHSLPAIARWIIKKSAARLPQHLSERYHEEWLAHVNECNGNIRKILVACGCLRASSTFLAEWRTGLDGFQAHLVIFGIRYIWLFGAIITIYTPLYRLKPIGLPLVWIYTVVAECTGARFAMKLAELHEDTIYSPVGTSLPERAVRYLLRVTAIARRMR